ncbi:MAG: hypothetical protein K6C69_03520 [Lachnospiraceae bacterium]|nr:hypothetical protein [Lachnospiraceae bacterium]
MKNENRVLDDIPEKAHQKIHTVSFTFLALIVGVVLFFMCQFLFVMFVVDDEDRAAILGSNETVSKVTPDSTLGHDYCGTFYIWITVGNNYGSVENYEAANNAGRAVKGIADNIVRTFSPILFLICMIIAFRQADKRLFFAHNGWRFLMAAGIAVLIQNIWSVIMRILFINAEQPFVTGIFENRRYYCQVYHLFGIPALIIMTALITRQHTLNLQKKDTSANSKALKGLSVLMGTVAAAFILVRLIIRVYEIINYKTHDAMIPFYSDLLTLPRELADSSEMYRELLVFRLLKDMPVFISSAVTVFMLIKIMLSSARNKINTPQNMKRFHIGMLLLFISSLIFNILGIHEVNVLNEHFDGIYGSVVYTIGLRALCDPVLYVVILWFVKTFVSISGNNTE